MGVVISLEMPILLAVLAGCLLIIILLAMLWGKMRRADEPLRQEIAELKRQLEISERTQAEQGRILLEQAARQNENTVKALTVLGDSLRDGQYLQQQAMQEQLARLRQENQASLDKINGTVNDKLQKTLDAKISQSFEAVNKRLAEVYAGLGEMKSVAAGVADLKNVLSNVKTRGILGEIQLAAILAEILAPEQYAEQLSVRPGSAEKVDFAVKLPGLIVDEQEKPVYLPIDAKFPGDSYANLLAAYERGEPDALKARRAALEAEIKRAAKSIHDKYIAPPYTTDFALMFLPFEGLYAEVVNLGLVEYLQRHYKVNIVGPSTMAAVLNSLQMGFRTLAIQQKSGEVWQILEAAKKEFANFENVLAAARNRLRQADDELDKLIGTRTRAINRRLQALERPDSENNSGLATAEEAVK